MEVKYKNTVEDLIELNFYLNMKLKDRRLKNYFFKYGYILIILPAFIWYFNYNYENLYIFSIFAIILSILWLTFVPIIIKFELKHKLEKNYITNEYLYSKRVLKIKNNKIVMFKNDNKSELSFQNISNVIIYKKRILIFEQNFNIFAIVPIKSFSNDFEKNKFLNEIKKNLY